MWTSQWSGEVDELEQQLNAEAQMADLVTVIEVSVIKLQRKATGMLLVLEGVTSGKCEALQY